MLGCVGAPSPSARHARVATLPHPRGSEARSRGDGGATRAATRARARSWGARGIGGGLSLTWCALRAADRGRVSGEEQHGATGRRGATNGEAQTRDTRGAPGAVPGNDCGPATRARAAARATASPRRSGRGCAGDPAAARSRRRSPRCGRRTGWQPARSPTRCACAGCGSTCSFQAQLPGPASRRCGAGRRPRSAGSGAARHPGRASHAPGRALPRRRRRSARLRRASTRLGALARVRLHGGGASGGFRTSASAGAEARVVSQLPESGTASSPNAGPDEEGLARHPRRAHGPEPRAAVRRLRPADSTRAGAHAVATAAAAPASGRRGRGPRRAPRARPPRRPRTPGRSPPPPGTSADARAGGMLPDRPAPRAPRAR